ncbi:MAG: toll/interleukin-1 receptor domain-containing protein [Leptolyngbyaceae cyanobacterium]
MPDFQDAFISYGRADSKAFAAKLNQRLLEAGLKSWFDMDDIPVGVDYQKQIDQGIELTHNFLFVISPHSVNSSYCGKELDLAARLHKRIIPILHVEETSYELWQARNPQGTEAEWIAYQAAGKHSCYPNMPPELARINWAFFREGVEDFEAAFAGLLDLFQQHQFYVRQHTQLLAQALQWQREQYQRPYLLAGEDLVAAQHWLRYPVKEANLPCPPTDLHCEFITESIKNAHNLMTQVFLSYAEEDRAIAHQIRRYLNHQGITVWTAQGDIQSGVDFHIAIQQGVEEADNVVFVLSPDACMSEYCSFELDMAQQYHKRIVPLLVAPVGLEKLPPAVQHLQHIDLTQPPDTSVYQQGMSRLFQTLQQDANYHATHKNLLVKALKWHRQNQNASILLRGHDLRRAEAWLSVARSKETWGATALHVALLEESLKQPPDIASDVFISYSRANADFARRLNEALQIHGKVTWFDQESIASGTDFQQEIYRGIESCDNFVFVLSPHAVQSPYCADEVDYAVRLNKRLIPLLYRPVETASVHSELSKIQWIEFSQTDGDFHASLGELIRTLDTDRDHVRNHTRWSRRALEWHQTERSSDLLLRGSEFALAESWLGEAIKYGKVPPPSALHRELIEASRVAIQAERNRERRQTTTLRSLLSIVANAYTQAEAQRQRAEIVQEGQIRALSRYSQALQAANQSLEARVESLRAGRQLQQQQARITVSTTLQAEVMAALRSTLSAGPEFNQLTGHTQPIPDVAISPDGQIIATASLDGTVRLWNPQGAWLRTLEGHTDGVYGVCFSPNGAQLATAGADHTVRLWSVTGNPMMTLMGHEDWVYGVCFRADGEYIASCSVDRTVRVWTLAGKYVRSLLHDDTVIDVCFSSDGARLATACVDAKVRLWHEDGTLLQVWEGHTGPVTTVRFSPQGDVLASGSVDGTLRLWDRASGNSEVLHGHRDSVWKVRFSSDGQTLVSASSDNSLIFWNRVGHSLLTLKGHQDTVSAVALHPHAPIVISGSYDKTIRFWRYTLPRVQIIAADAAGVNDVALLAADALAGQDGTASIATDRSLAIAPNTPAQATLLATADARGNVQVWTPTGKNCRSWPAHNDPVKGIAWNAPAKILATASIDTTVKLWRSSGELLNSLLGHHLAVRRIAFSPDGQWLATASYDKTVGIWSVTGERICTLQGHTDQVWDVAFAPSNRGKDVLLATTGWDKTVCLWRLEEVLQSENRSATAGRKDGLKPWRIFEGHQDVVANLCFSPTGDRLATASQDRTVKVWSLEGQLQYSLEHEQAVMAVCFSPDGRWIATAGFDRQITLWSSDGRQLQTLAGHTDTIWQLQFQDTQLISASEDGTVRIWFLDRDHLSAVASLHDLPLEALIDRACHQVQDYLKHNLSLEASDRTLCQER